MNDNLPPLPPKMCALLHAGGRLDYYGEHQMREYGQLCRQQALEDAAKSADAFQRYGYDYTGNLLLSEFIRSMK